MRRAAVTNTDNAAEAFQILGDWLRDRGATVPPSIAISVDDGQGGGRTIVTIDPMTEGQVVLELPLVCCLAAAPGAQVRLTGAFPAFEEAGLDPADAALAVALAHERTLGDQSAWWAYVRCVGDPEATFPCLFAEGDLEALQSRPLAETFDAVDKALGKLAECTGMLKSELAAAMQLVRSRRFGYEEGRYMLPLGDLCNHSFYPTCVWEKPTAERRSWRLVALKDLQPADSLTFSYCSDPNHLLLSTSGFIVPNNPFSRIMAKPADLRRSLEAVSAEGSGAKAAPDFKAWRKAEIEKNLSDPDEDGAGVSMFLVGRQGAGTQWNPLWLNLCGLAIASGMEGEHWSRREGGVQEYLGAVEKASWKLFETTAEEDRKLLESGDLTANRRMCVEFRLDQKAVLQDAINGFRGQVEAAAAGAKANADAQ